MTATPGSAAKWWLGSGLARSIAGLFSPWCVAAFLVLSACGSAGDRDAGPVQFTRAVSVSEAPEKPILGQAQTIRPKQGHSLWVVTLRVPAHLENLDGADMKLAGTAGPIAAIGWRHTADEQPGEFHVNTTVGSSQLFDPEGGGPAKAAYLHALFEIPDSEEPARYDWKQRTRPLVERLTPAQN